MVAQIEENLAASVMDALTSNICVVDLTGEILAVNRAWIEFNATNSSSDKRVFVGTNYLNVCRSSSGPASDEAAAFYAGLRDVLEGRKEIFQVEYPCHSPNELRWFLARVTPLMKCNESTSAERFGAVVSHMNITDRKLVELDYARLASTDPLTNLPNRRFFEHYATMELRRLQRFGGTMSVLMLDLDKFKTINDTYGHLVGDTVLKKVAARCKGAVRDNDLFARMGGEEFVALLPGADTSGALCIAEKLRRLIESLKIKTDAGTLRITSSIGVTSLTSSDRSIKSALDRADRALYACKNAGRNSVRAAA